MLEPIWCRNRLLLSQTLIFIVLAAHIITLLVEKTIDERVGTQEIVVADISELLDTSQSVVAPVMAMPATDIKMMWEKNMETTTTLLPDWSDLMAGFFAGVYFCWLILFRRTTK